MGDVDKSGDKSGLVPQEHGGAIKQGGTHVRTGRPPNEWKQALRELADRPSVLKHVQTALDNGPEENERAFFSALDYVTSHGYGKPEQRVDVTSKGEQIVPGVMYLPRED